LIGIILMMMVGLTNVLFLWGFAGGSSGDLFLSSLTSLTVQTTGVTDSPFSEALHFWVVVALRQQSSSSQLRLLLPLLMSTASKK
jgi:hypothetical protein